MLTDDVVSEKGFGVFKIQTLRGCTDNPLRLTSKVVEQESWVFGIESVGWNILSDILDMPKTKFDSQQIFRLNCLSALVREYPQQFGTIEY